MPPTACSPPRYRPGRSSSPTPTPPGSATHPRLPGFPTGAFHAAELQYLFSGAYASGQLSPAQQRLSDEMIAAWTRFAHTGNPNGEGITPWPRFHGVRGHVQSLAPGPGGIHQVDLGREHRCGFWRSLGA